MKIINFVKIITAIIVMIAVSCVAPEEWGDHYENIVPDPVSNVKVENVNGGAIISYTLPAHKDMLGAKVAYSLTPGGEQMERWTSVEKDTIVLEGYGDTNERTVTVYAVHKSGNVSTGVTATIKPLTPPVEIIRESLEAFPAFGGVKVSWNNLLRKDMGIALYVEDPITHEMMLFDKYFSNSIDGQTIFRTLEPEEQKIRIEMFDRWQNYASALETTLTPLEEVELVPIDERGNAIWSLFDDGRVIPGDNTSPWRYTYRCDNHNNLEYANTIERTFDKCFVFDHFKTPWWHCGVTLTQEMFIPGAGPSVPPYPTYVTMDLGRKAVYSRMKYVDYNTSAPFAGNFPVEISVWGCNDPKTIEEVEDPHGIYPKGSREANQAYWSSWVIANGADTWKNDWVKIAYCTYSFASGETKYSAGLTFTEQDIYEWDNGWDYEFDLGVFQPFRYIRWEIHDTNSVSNTYISCNGLKYFGSYAE